MARKSKAQIAHEKLVEEHAALAMEQTRLGLPYTKGFHWVTNIMTRKPVQEPDGTPYTLSVASETYWSS